MLIGAAQAGAEPGGGGQAEHLDLAYVSGGHERQKLDLFLPEGAGSPVPLVIWVHGGGWQAGSRKNCPLLRQGYLERGYAVASIGYRLTGDAIFPAQIEDCKAAIRWLRARAAEYRLDPEHFGVAGSSAGGHLVALLGTSGGEEAFDVGENADASSEVQAVVDYFGPTDLAVFAETPGYESHARENAPEGKLLGGAVADRPEQARAANPITYVDGEDPPFLIIHGSADPTVPLNQSQLLHEALVAAEVPSHFITVKGGGHGKGFPSSALSETAADFFDRHLRGQTDKADWPAAKTSEVDAVTSGQAGAGRPRPGTPPRVRFERVLQDDADGDRTVTRSEFAGPPRLFDRLDRDASGTLTATDFEESE